MYGTDRPLRLILAGGNSRRMGQDKALLPWGKETLLERAVRFWLQSGRVDRVLVAEGTPGRLAPLPQGAEPVADLIPRPGAHGGAGGRLSGLRGGSCSMSAPWTCPICGRRPSCPPGARCFRVPPGWQAGTPVRGVPGQCGTGSPKAAGPGQRQNVRSAEGGGDRLLLYTTLSGRDTAKSQYSGGLSGGPGRVAPYGDGDGLGKLRQDHLLRGLIPALGRRGLRVAVLKHDAHGFEMDREGKDTWLLSQAGAEAWPFSGRTSGRCWAEERQLDQLRRCLPPVDLILGRGSSTAICPSWKFTGPVPDGSASPGRQPAGPDYRREAGGARCRSWGWRIMRAVRSCSAAALGCGAVDEEGNLCYNP